MCCILQVAEEVVIRWENQLPRFFPLGQLLSIQRHSSAQGRVGVLTGLSRQGRKDLSHVKQMLEIVSERGQATRRAAFQVSTRRSSSGHAQTSLTSTRFVLRSVGIW